MEQVAMVHNGNPPAADVNEITNFPNIDQTISMPSQHFDMSGMNGMKLG